MLATNTTSIVDITGATLLTLIDAVVTDYGAATPTISGNVTVLGVAE
jgi:hypothetical protein